MQNFLEFLKEPNTIEILLVLSDDDTTQRDLCKQLKIGRTSLQNSLNRLRLLNLVSGSHVTLTPRGKYVSTLLNNLNFYLGGNRMVKRKKEDE